MYYLLGNSVLSIIQLIHAIIVKTWVLHEVSVRSCPSLVNDPWIFSRNAAMSDIGKKLCLFIAVYL